MIERCPELVGTENAFGYKDRTASDTNKSVRNPDCSPVPLAPGGRGSSDYRQTVASLWDSGRRKLSSRLSGTFESGVRFQDGIVTEEADESAFWIELLSDLGIMKKDRLEDLLRESRELTAIFSASRQTAKQK